MYCNIELSLTISKSLYLGVHGKKNWLKIWSADIYASFGHWSQFASLRTTAEPIRQPAAIFGLSCQRFVDLSYWNSYYATCCPSHRQSSQSQSQSQSVSQSLIHSPVVGFAQFWQKRWKFKIDHQAECLSKLPGCWLLAAVCCVLGAVGVHSPVENRVYVECRLKPKQCHNCLPFAVHHSLWIHGMR